MSSYLKYEKIIIPSFYCFAFIYIIRFVIVIRREDWFLMWIGLEINIISFLVLIYRRYDLGVIESCLKYFFIQSLGSSLFIRVFYLGYWVINCVVVIVLRYKIGAGPFFYWFPSLCSGLEWMSCYFLILFQKFLPLLLISLFIHWIIWIIIIIRLIIGVLGSFNQRNIKQLLAYSSIHHLGWILIIETRNSVCWLIYLILYGLVLFSVVVLLLKNEIVDISILYSNKNKIVFLIRILRIGGIPPLLGFFLKWIVLVNIIRVNILLLIILIVVSVLILYVYIRISYDVIMGGRREVVIDFNINYYFMNIENLSLLGIIRGIVLGVWVII